MAVNVTKIMQRILVYTAFASTLSNNNKSGNLNTQRDSIINRHSLINTHIHIHILTHTQSLNYSLTNTFMD